MDLNDYQAMAHYTSAFHTDGVGSTEHVTMSILGLCGEAGELADNVKKVLYHNHPLDHSTIILELGDILWYIAEACTAFGLTLEDVAESNIAKLKSRYAEGFSSEASINRTEGA